jgi:hypothetical protein
MPGSNASSSLLYGKLWKNAIEGRLTLHSAEMLPLQYLYKTCMHPNTCLHTTYHDSKLHSTSSVPQNRHERLQYTPPAGYHTVGFVDQWHNVHTSFTEKSVKRLKSYNGGAETDYVILGDNHTEISNMSHMILYLIWVFTINQTKQSKSIGKTGHHHAKKKLICAFHQT